GARPDLDPASAGTALRKVLGRRNDETQLRFAVVHPHSSHNYELRYWLTACGTDPDREVELVLIPPPLMGGALAAGRIDCHCVAGPWDWTAPILGIDHIVTPEARIWQPSPQKVLGVSDAWAMANPDTLDRLLRALYRAAKWCGDAANHPELAALLARAEY